MRTSVSDFVSNRNKEFLVGLPLHYLIGVDDEEEIEGEEGCVFVMPFGRAPAKLGKSIGYCNLLAENREPEYGPYVAGSDTARKYKEGQMDPGGLGWIKCLTDQFILRKQQGYEYIELDNADSYPIGYVLSAITMAASHGLKVIAKNPLLMEDGPGDALLYLEHPNVYGVIVERNGGTPNTMNALRKRSGKTCMMVWFVGYGIGATWANATANDARHFGGMGVSYSRQGEYESSEILLRPHV